MLSGQGGIRVDGETRAIRPGDVLVIALGERHKVWQEGVPEGALCLDLYATVPLKLQTNSGLS